MLLGVGLWGICTGVPKQGRSLTLDHRGRSVIASVVDAKQHHWCGPRTCNYWTDVTVVFTDADGAVQEVTAHGPDEAISGEQVQITYDPLHPEQIRFSGKSDSGIPLIAMGVVFTVVGTLIGPVAITRGYRRNIPLDQMEADRAAAERA